MNLGIATEIIRQDAIERAMADFREHERRKASAERRTVHVRGVHRISREEALNRIGKRHPNAALKILNGYGLGNRPVPELRVFPDGESFTVQGYAAVYNQTSHDLGGFRERVAPGAFDEVPATNPDVHMLWNHDSRYVLGRTKNGTLNLRSDARGLRIDAKVAPASFAKDLRLLLERGDIDQGSFAFTVADNGDEFTADDNGNVMRTIRNIGGLYDVTVTAQGAYPQTSLGVAH